MNVNEILILLTGVMVVSVMVYIGLILIQEIIEQWTKE